MSASGKKGLEISGNQKIGFDPIPNSQISIGNVLDLGIVNQYGQLIGEYSRLDEELWLPDHEDEEAAAAVDVLNRINEEGQKCHLLPSVFQEQPELSLSTAVGLHATTTCPQHENMAHLEQPLDCVNNAACDVGMTHVKEEMDSSQNQTQTSSPVSVFQTNSMRFQNKCRELINDNLSGGLQVGIISAREESRVPSDSEYSMESSLSDEAVELIPVKQVRTRKISELLDLDSAPAVKKCRHCKTTETPQWRTGPMGRKTLCNACGVQYKHGRLYSDYRPLKSPTFDPSIHSNLPKRVQDMRRGSTIERGPNPISKLKKVEMRMGNTSKRGSNPTSKPKKVDEMMMMCHSSDRSSNPSPKPEKVEEMKLVKVEVNYGDMSEDLTSVPKRVEEMILGKNNERDQNHAHRAKKFHAIREKDSDEFQFDDGEWNPKFDTEVILKRKRPAKLAKKCLHCESTETPQWREGPMGRKTLCNACGVQYRAGRLFPEYRPLKSPTYDPLLHSHLPKKVLEMRMRIAEKCATSSNHEKAE